MDMTWKYIKPLKKESAVKDFLSNNKVVLPNSLVALIEENNGGRPSNKTIITDTNREYVFRSLMSFNSEDIGTIYNIYPTLFEDSSLFPFGLDSAGNFICYDTKSQLFVLFNHEADKTEIIVEAPFLGIKIVK